VARSCNVPLIREGLAREIFSAWSHADGCGSTGPRRNKASRILILLDVLIGRWDSRSETHRGSRQQGSSVDGVGS